MLLLVSYGIRAQSQELTLKDCLKLAIDNNQNLQAARLDMQAGEYQVKEVKGQALPQVTGSARYTNNVIKPIIVLPGEFIGLPPGEIATIEAGTTHNVAMMADATQQVFNAALFQGIKAAKKSTSFYSLKYQMAEEEVISNVAGAYYQVQVTLEKLNLIDINIASTEKLIAIMEVNYRNGLLKKIDLDRLKVSLTNLRTQRDEVLNAIAMQQNQLKYLMGVPIETALTVKPIEANSLEVNSSLENYDTLNLNNQRQYQLLKTQEELLEIERSSLVAEFYPSLSLFAQYSYNGVSNRFDLLDRKGSSTWYDMGYVGLALRVPIFSGLSKHYKVKQSDVKLLKAKEELKAAAIGIRMNHDNAVAKLQNSLNTIRAQEDNVKLALEIYEVTQSNYQEGLASLTDLLNAESSWREAQNNYNEALLRYKLAELELIKNKGNIKSLLNA